MNLHSLGRKVKSLRKVNELTQEELAEKAGITRAALNAIENGRAKPRTSNLYRMAKVFNVKIADFFEVVPDMAEVRFRCKKCKTKKQMDTREELLNKVKMWLNNFCVLEKLMKKQPEFDFDINQAKLKSPKEIAASARHKLGLSETEPINDICGLVESKGIKLFLFNENDDNLSGISLIHKGKYPAIAVNVNNEISVERQIFTVAHELGHIYMHRESFNVNEVLEIEKQEAEADRFGSYFLMPEKAFIAKLQENKGLHWVHSVLDIKRYFKVSYKTVLRRLIDMRLTDSNAYRVFAVQYKAIYGHDLKNHYEPHKLDRVDFMEVRLIGLVRDAIEKEIITVSRAAEILGISLQDMRERGKYWSPPDGEEKNISQ
ncbi:MAG: DNA-binding protein [Candidatus Goldiibacteriota bacterium HGW-Goldbacteria-1]|jgi:Zn-dependent peptidase ImmA (M78 family)/DNA-binding XRE family transcriptional regulator|nr:MAG: DNA-binding protein [Candidatus Goldiibacteriota bacterium HGW-Goldbacteria-1]